jgi:uncharacterized protein involved in exopolysaccharide biosynthesis
MTTQPSDTLDIRPYIEPVIRYRPLIATFCIAATLSSLGFTYVVSERYKARATILYQPREQVSFRPKSRDALGFPPPLVPLESIGNTLQEVVQSDGLIEETVRALNLHVKEPKPAANWFMTAFGDTKDRIKEWRDDTVQVLKYGRILPKDPFRDAMQTLQANVSIKRTAKAYTFELEVVHENPRRAARIVDTVGSLLARFLAAEHGRSARESREKIEPRLRQASEEIAALRNSIESFRAHTGVSSLTQELSLKLEAVSDLEKQLTDVTRDLQATGRRREEIARQLEEQEPNVRYESTQTENPIVEDMKLAAARLEVERSGLLEKFTPNHPDVRAIDAKLEQTRRRLAQEVTRIVSSESTRVNDIRRNLLAERLAADAEIETLRAKSQALAASIGERTASARMLTEKEPELSELTLKLKAAEQAYELIHEAYEESRLAEARTTSEVAMLHRALEPTAPARPIKVVHVGTSLVLSLCLGIGLALLTNLLDSTLRTIDQTERALGLHVLTTIPEVRGREDLLDPRSASWPAVAGEHL